MLATVAALRHIELDNEKSPQMLFDTWDEPWFDLHHFDVASLGPEYVLDSSGHVFPAFFHQSFGNHFTNFRHSFAPSHTLVGSPGGLQFDLVWDASVANAPSGFKQAVIAAATYYTTLFSNDEVIKIAVGYGEMHGTRLASDAIGASESNGYLTSYTTTVNALGNDNYPPSLAQNEPTSAQFFITRAEAKALGLISGSSTAVDGYIGLSSTDPISYSPSGPASGSGQYDAVAIAEHEIGEVMGRIGLEGGIVAGKHTYTPLDLFNFQGPGILELSANGGYFSVDNGATSLGTFDNASANGGDMADWASNAAPTGSTYDAYDAFTWAGYHGVVTPRDIIVDAALGYELTPTGLAAV
jgi:hypothetical protein